VAMQWVLARFEITPFNSLLVTFGITVVIESGIQALWTADFRRMETHYNDLKFTIGSLYVPVPELLTLVLSVTIALSIWAVMRYTDLGKAMRAMAEDGPIASAFGIDQKGLSLILAGLCASLAAVAGICLALTFTLTPSQIFAWVGVVFAAVMLGGLGSPLGPLVAGIIIGVSDRGAAVFARKNQSMNKTSSGILIAGALLASVPWLELPAFYESFLYLMCSWMVLALSWNILSGYSGYFSFGHGAFFGIGMYATANLAAKWHWPFLWTLPAAAALAALLGLGLGAVVFRVKSVTLAVTFVVGTIVLNTPIDGGPGIFLNGVKIPAIGPTPSASMYLMVLAAAVLTLLISYQIYVSRLGLGLFAIHDDEDVAEVMGVPTYRYKLLAFGLSCALAGLAGGIHALFVSYVTAGETFTIVVPLTVVLMSVLGGTRHWAGPAVGAVFITGLMYFFTAGNNPLAGKAAVGVILVVVILFMPSGILGYLFKRKQGKTSRDDSASRHSREGGNPEVPDTSSPAKPRIPGQAGNDGKPLLEVRQLTKAFTGVVAVDALDLQVFPGEILGLLGPNGSGKSTFINVVSGHYPITSGEVFFEGRALHGQPAHRIAQAGIARTYQIPRPFAHLTVLQNVALVAMFGGESLDHRQATQEAASWLAFTGLSDKADVLPDALNLHQRKFLELARALAGRPRLVLLDEVLSGLTPGEINEAIALIRKIRERGATIVFVEHVMHAVMALADRVAVLNYGKLIAVGLPQDVMQNPEVVKAYLGTMDA
jgi:branched-chain amino acid transport system permease protein